VERGDESAACSIFDDESSMGGCAGAGISEAFDLVFRWMRGDVDL
jgi:hypothetical protein